MIEYTAPEWRVNQWIDVNGNKMDSLRLSDFKGKFKVLFCFQSWCPGCHSQGFPVLQMMVKTLKANDQIVFLAVQTVFEGFHVNTYDKLAETQKRYHLKIPFGHDAGDDGKTRSNLMIDYQTGGTPWFIFIDQNDTVVFEGFHLDIDNAIDYLTQVTIIIKQPQEGQKPSMEKNNVEKYMEDKYEVVHNKDKDELVMDIDGKMATVDYRHRDGKLWLVHSEVPLSLRGQGLGKILVDKSLKKLTEEGHKTVAVCPFIRKVVEESPHWKEIVEYE